MAFTSIPVVGKLRAAVLSSLITEVRPVFARKTSDQSVNNSTVLVNDSELLVSVAANTVYYMLCRLKYNSNSTADIKVGWTFPSGLTMDYTAIGFNVGGAFVSPTLIQTDVPGYGGGALSGSADDAVTIHGLVIVGSTAGTLQMQFAQNTANVSNTTIKSTSFLWLKQAA